MNERNGVFMSHWKKTIKEQVMGKNKVHDGNSAWDKRVIKDGLHQVIEIASNLKLRV